jgi:hypothetical protein
MTTQRCRVEMLAVNDVEADERMFTLLGVHAGATSIDDDTRSDSHEPNTCTSSLISQCNYRCHH